MAGKFTPPDGRRSRSSSIVDLDFADCEEVEQFDGYTKFVSNQEDLGIIVADPDKQITHINHGFTSITGYTSSEAVGRSCGFLQGENTSAEAIKLIKDSLDSNQPVKVAILNYRKNREPFWNFLSITPLFDRNGVVSTYVGITVCRQALYVDKSLGILHWSTIKSSEPKKLLLTNTPSPTRTSIPPTKADIKRNGLNGLNGYFQRHNSKEAKALTQESPSTQEPQKKFLRSTTVSFVSETKLPTLTGVFRMIAFKDRSKPSIQSEIIVMANGDFKGKSGVPCRVHDACFTSEVMGSMKCDCREQLDFAKEYIRKDHGLVIYMPQEGRGIGLANKIKAYAMQELGYDTVDANRVLGFDDDYRDYSAVPTILDILGVKSIKLLTNNPRKITHLTGLGINIDGRIAVEVELNQHSKDYVNTKKKRMGHMLSEFI